MPEECRWVYSYEPPDVMDNSPLVAFTLPFPPNILSPNNRAHWAKKAPFKAAYFAECYILARQAIIKANRPPIPANTKVHLTLTFTPRRRMDADNAIASFKTGIDAIAKAIRVDDSLFDYTFKFLPADRARAGVFVSILGGSRGICEM